MFSRRWFRPTEGPAVSAFSVAVPLYGNGGAIDATLQAKTILRVGVV